MIEAAKVCSLCQIRQATYLVIVTPDLDPVLGFEIVKDGRLIFQKQPDDWMRERSRLWHAYNDSLPFRRVAYRRLQQFVRENPYGS